MDDKELEHRLTDVEARSKSNTHRIDKLEPVVEEIHNMSNTMVQLLETMKHTNENVTNLNEKMDKIDSRVDEIEKTPVKDFRDSKRVLINSIIGVIGGALAVGFITLISQNI